MRVVAALTLLGLLPQQAFAHAPIEGFEGFYKGILHPVTTPEQMLLVVGLSLMALVASRRTVGFMLAGYSLALLVGAAWILALRPELQFLPALLALAFVAGALAAASVAPSALVAAGIGAGAGLLMGAESVPDPGPTNSVVITLTGSLLGAALLLVYCYGLLDELRKRIDRPWTEIVIRALGAWVVAAALLVGALLLGPGLPDQPLEAAQSQ